MSTIRTSCWISVSLALFSGLSAIGSIQGQERDVLFEDDFSVLDGSFTGAEHMRVSVKDSSLVIDADATWMTRKFYQTATVEDADVSAEFRLADLAAETGAYIALGFWIKDYGEYSYVALSDSGTVGIFSTNPNRTFTLYDWQKSDAIKTGPNEWNEIRVVTVANHALIYLNGKKLAKVKGNPPTGGSLLGFIYNAGNNPSTGFVRNLRALTPTAEDVKLLPATTDDPNVIVADDFSEFNSGWGSPDGHLFVKDQALVIKPDAEKSTSRLFSAATAEAMDATYKLKLTDGADDSEAFAGMIFWSQPDDYSILLVGDTGNVMVVRWKKDRWLYPMESRALPPEAKFQPNAVNNYRIVATNRKATFYVNGAVIGAVNSTPLKGDWQFGVYAMNGKAPATAEFSSLMIRKLAEPKK